MEIGRFVSQPTPSKTAIKRAAWALLLCGMSAAIHAETDQEYCNRQEGPAKTACLKALDTAKTGAMSPADAAASSATGTYKVVDGTHVDAFTLKGFHVWRAAACDRCHGPNQEGLVGPSLITSLKTLSKDDFVKTLKEGRLEKGMPSWSTNPQVMDNVDALYAYLKGRSDGAITKAKVEPIQ